MTTTTEPTGFRRDIVVLHALSELMEKNPALPRPQVEFGSRYQVEQKAHISWYIHADWNIKQEGHYWDHGKTYEEWDAGNKELRRVDLEQRIAAILDSFGPDVEWEKNDPSQDEYYYKLSTVWAGAAVTITTTRESVCEKVVVLETEHEEEVPDPELHETFLKAVPKVKVMVKDTVSEWQCNTALAEKTAPKYSVTTKTEVVV